MDILLYLYNISSLSLALFYSFNALLRLKNLRQFKTVYNIIFLIKHILGSVNIINCVERMQLHVATLCPFCSLALYEDGWTAVALQTPVLMPRDWFRCQHRLGFRICLQTRGLLVIPLVSRPLLAQLCGPHFPRNLTRLDKIDISAY